MLNARNILQDAVGLTGFPVGECKLEREGGRSQRLVWAGYRVICCKEKSQEGYWGLYGLPWGCQVMGKGYRVFFGVPGLTLQRKGDSSGDCKTRPG